MSQPRDPPKMLSKEEILKRYLEPQKSKKKKATDITVRYISGDLPETLNSLCDSGNEFLSFATDEDLGINAQTIVRNRKPSPTLKELEEQVQTARKEAEIKAKYSVWSKGIKTLQDKEQKINDDAYQSAKPLARYADDEDLTKHLKSRIFADDPMADYFRKKNDKIKKNKKSKKKKDLDNSDSDSIDSTEETVLKYKGPPEPPSNRFNIWPGFRWDGVDRSNGFERKYVEETTRKRLEKQLADQWGMEDM